MHSQNISITVTMTDEARKKSDNSIDAAEQDALAAGMAPLQPMHRKSIEAMVIGATAVEMIHNVANHATAQLRGVVDTMPLNAAVTPGIQLTPDGPDGKPLGMAVSVVFGEILAPGEEADMPIEGMSLTLPTTLIEALRTIDRLNPIGDAVYRVRENADLTNHEGDSWEHPDVVAYGKAAEVIREFLALQPKATQTTTIAV